MVWFLFFFFFLFPFFSFSFFSPFFLLSVVFFGSGFPHRAFRPVSVYSLFFCSLFSQVAAFVVEEC